MWPSTFGHERVMLVAASVVSTNHSRLRVRWKLEGGPPPLPGQKTPGATSSGWQRNDVPLHWAKSAYRLPPDGELGPSVSVPPDFIGLMQVYDWDTGAVVWRSAWQNCIITPYGFCFADGVMYVADLEGSHIFEVDTGNHWGEPLKRISHPYLNDLHTIERTARGLLVTSSGVDAVLELGLDGALLWDWWASDHGYDMTPAGVVRPSARGREHRDQYYHTRYQTTHVNSAVVDGDDERYVLALLFHQGRLIRIDRHKPLHAQSGEVVLDGLFRPHGLERTPSGWIFANSVGGELVLLDRALCVSDRITYEGGWIQDCTRLSDGRILLNDVDCHRIVEFAGPPWIVRRVVPYDTEWRMAELREIPPPYRAAFARIG